MNLVASPDRSETTRAVCAGDGDGRVEEDPMERSKRGAGW
jgi:hypothetical protein